MAYEAQRPAPVLVSFNGPALQRRWTVLLRLILVIPQFIVLVVVAIAAFVVVVIGWFGALFTGRLPAFPAEFLTGWLRWQTRVMAYVSLLTDVYPPFTLQSEDTYPIRITVAPGDRLNRWAVLFRFILIVPANIVASVVLYGTFTIVGFVVWLITVFTGQMPPSAYWAFAAIVRYQTRFNGYLFMLTSEYPWGLFGDTEVLYGAPPTPGYGLPSAYTPTAAYGASSSTAAYGAPSPTAAYGAPSPTATYGAPTAYGAPPPQPQPQTPPPPAPAEQPPASGAFGTSAPTAPAPMAPVLPGVAFTFGGPGYLWGYTDDRTYCGIWNATDLRAPPQRWPIGDQGEAWARFRDLEPNAVALADPVPPPPPSFTPSFSPTMPTTPTMATPAMMAPPPGAVSYPPPPPAYVAAPPPGPGAPGWSPADDPRWRLVLSQSSKALLIVMLVLGSITYGVYTVAVAAGSHPFQTVVANVEVQQAYESLTNTVSAFQSASGACPPTAVELSCTTSADETAALAFGKFAQDVTRISLPSRADDAAETVEADALRVQRIYESLAGTTSALQYLQTLQSSGLAGVLHQFDTDYQALLDHLSGLS